MLAIWSLVPLPFLNPAWTCSVNLWSNFLFMGGAVFPEEPGSLCPASFCTQRPNLPVTPGISWLPTFAFPSSLMKKTSFHHLRSNYARVMATTFKGTYASGPQDCCFQCSWPRGRPLLTHASIRDSWTLTGMSSSVSCGVPASFSWVPVCTRLCVCPPRVCLPSPLELL